MLTKEECENVLSENKIYLKNQMLKKERISHSVYLLNTVTSLLERLIHEHFDNPPLKFDELEEGMWIWDNKMVLYIRIAKIIGKTIYTEDFLYGFDCYGRYEKNRFYRKQVEE